MKAPVPDQGLSAAGKAAAAARKADQLKRKAGALATMHPTLAGIAMARGRGTWEASLRAQLEHQHRALLAALAKAATLALAVGSKIRDTSEREGAEYVAGIAQAAGWTAQSASACRDAAQLHQAAARRARKMAGRGRALSPIEVFQPSADPAATLGALLELVAPEYQADLARAVQKLRL